MHIPVGKKVKIQLQLMLHRMELSHVRYDNKMIGKITNEIRKLEKAVSCQFK
jgi:hypothetical protein